MRGQVLRSWALCMGDPDGMPGSWLESDPAPAIGDIWGMNQGMKVSIQLWLLGFPIKKNNNKVKILFHGADAMTGIVC